jgi:hypothetical protein
MYYKLRCYMYQQVWYSEILHSARRVRICVFTVFRKAIIFLHNINKSFYKPRRSVYSAVRNACTGHEGIQGKPFFTWTLNGGEWSAPCPGRLTPRGIDLPYTLNKRLGGIHRRCQVSEKNIMQVNFSDYIVVVIKIRILV